jgi:hypothetical protein
MEERSNFETAEGRSTARDGLNEKFTGSKPADMSWLRQISQHVAEASNEGGFLGIGGVPVSEAEKATLTEISSAPKLAA